MVVAAVCLQLSAGGQKEHLVLFRQDHGSHLARLVRLSKNKPFSLAFFGGAGGLLFAKSMSCGFLRLFKGLFCFSGYQQIA